MGGWVTLPASNIPCCSEPLGSRPTMYRKVKHPAHQDGGRVRCGQNYACRQTQGSISQPVGICFLKGSDARDWNTVEMLAHPISRSAASMKLPLEQRLFGWHRYCGRERAFRMASH